MAAGRFSHFGQKPMNAGRGRGVSEVFGGGGPSIFSEAGHKSALTKTDTICGREAGTRRSQNRRRDVMRQQHAVVGAAIPLPCENERRRSLGAERECEVCRLGGRAAIDSGSHGGGGGLVGGSTAALIFGFFWAHAGGACRGSLGEAPSKKDGLTKSAHLGRGRNGSSRHFNFFWNAVSSPPRAVNKLRAGARGANIFTWLVPVAL